MNGKKTVESLNVDYKKQAKTNRSKGHTLERDVVKKFREIGVNCDTSRYASRRLDDLKVDIAFENIFFPLNIQCKCHNIHKNPIPTLEEMPDSDKYNVVFEKVKRKGIFVYMKEEDFMEIVKVLIKEQIWES